MRKNYIIHIRNFKEVFYHGLVPTKVHRAIKFDKKGFIIHWYKYRAKSKFFEVNK